MIYLVYNRFGNDKKTIFRNKKIFRKSDFFRNPSTRNISKKFFIFEKKNIFRNNSEYSDFEFGNFEIQPLFIHKRDDF